MFNETNYITLIWDSRTYIGDEENLQSDERQHRRRVKPFTEHLSFTSGW